MGKKLDIGVDSIIPGVSAVGCMACLDLGKQLDYLEDSGLFTGLFV